MAAEDEAGGMPPIRIEDASFQVHLASALTHCELADAAVLIDLNRRDVRQGAGDREGIEILHALGIALLSPDRADAAEHELERETLGAGHRWVWTAGDCQLLPWASGDAALVMAVASNTGFRELLRLQRLLQFDDADGARRCLAQLSEAQAVGRSVLQVGDATPDVYRRAGSERSTAWRGFDDRAATDLIAEARRWTQGTAVSGERDWIRSAMQIREDGCACWQRIPYCPQWIAGMSAPTRVDLCAPSEALCNDVLRDVVGRCLSAGLDTMTEPFPETAADFETLQRQLRALDADDLKGRLVVGGFADHPVGEGEATMRCAECIYFLRHRRWCDLPELPIPVEADWFCRLWRL